MGTLAFIALPFVAIIAAGAVAVAANDLVERWLAGRARRPTEPGGGRGSDTRAVGRDVRLHPAWRPPALPDGAAHLAAGPRAAARPHTSAAQRSGGRGAVR